jgi:hypothetical protein
MKLGMGHGALEIYHTWLGAIASDIISIQITAIVTEAMRLIVGAIYEHWYQLKLKMALR